jgi:hypothetical protein
MPEVPEFIVARFEALFEALFEPLPATLLALRSNFSARFIFARRIGRTDSNLPVESRASSPGGDTVDF